MASQNLDTTWVVHADPYTISIVTKELQRVKDALQPTNSCTLLGARAVEHLNLTAFLKQGQKVSVEDQLLELQLRDSQDSVPANVEGMDWLRSLEEDSELTLTLRGKPPSLKSVKQLRPPNGLQCAWPSKGNSIFFLLRSSTDGSLVKSVNGYGPNRYQVWCGSRTVNDDLEKAFASYEHVFCFVMFRREMRGIVRMSSKPDESLFGNWAFWVYEDCHQDRWKNLLDRGSNFRVQWLHECEVPIDSDKLKNFEKKKKNSHFFEQIETGSCLSHFRNDLERGCCLGTLGDSNDYFRKNQEGMEACWTFQESLFRCERSSHAGKTPEITRP